MTIISPILPAGLILLLGAAFVVWLRVWRHPPYQLNDLEQSVKRIQECMAGLAVPAHGADAAALRRDCRLMRRDLRDAAGFILLQASDAVRRQARHRQRPLSPDIFAELKNIDRIGRSLMRRSRWAGVQLVFPSELDSAARSLLAAGDQFAELCTVFGEFLGGPASGGGDASGRAVECLRR